MRIEIDVSDDQGNAGFEPLPEGTYNVRIVDAQYGPKEGKDYNQIVLLFQITDGPCEGRKFRCWYPQLPQTMWKTKRLLLASGINFGERKNGNGTTTFQFDTDDLINAAMRMNATVGEYNNKPKNDFEELAPLAAAAAATSTPPAATAPAD